MLALLLVTISVVVLIAQLLLHRTKLPPGPMPLPLLGNLPHLGFLVFRKGGVVAALGEWKKIYGPVFTVWLGPMPTVHIVEGDLAMEVMVNQGAKYADRWAPLLFKIAIDDRGIVSTNGTMWSEQRRFALHTLRNFGLGRNIMEERIMSEFDLRCEDLNKELEKGNETVKASRFFDLLVGSIINRMLFSVRFTEENEKEFFELKSAFDETLNSFAVFDLCMKKWFLDVPILRNRYERLLKPMYLLKDFLKRQVAERKAEIESGDHVVEGEGADYVDAFLLKMKEEKSNNTSFDEPSLIGNLFDLWTAGQETTTTTLSWACIYLLHNPEHIEKVRDEVSTVTGRERSLSLLDKSKTPYLNATIMEVQRLASILNMNLWRETTESTTVGGHPVEKGTPITAQLSLILNDEKLFQDSCKFDPTRFLSGDRLEQHVNPFGLGKRACLGESLARAELYLILGNLLLRYELLPALELPNIRESSYTGIVRRPRQFNMIVRKV